MELIPIYLYEVPALLSTKTTVSLSTFAQRTSQVQIQSSCPASILLFLLFQPQPTCLVVQCARAELQPSPPTRWRENRSRRRSSLRRGLPRLRPWPEDSRLRKGPSSSIMAACKFLISPTNALATPTQELFLDLRSVFPTGEMLPAASLLWHAILQWLDIFHGRAALKQQNRQVNKPRPLSGAALFWFDFFLSFCLL